MKKLLSILLVLVLSAGLLAGCSTPKPPVAKEESVTLTLAGPWKDFLAIERVTEQFTAQNPQCRVVYEYIQDYNTSVEKRLSSGVEGGVDLFLTTNLQAESPLTPYALDLFSRKDLLDLSHAYEGLIRNFTYMEADANAPAKLYAVPLGSVMRGMYVNKTLLKSAGIESVPQNRAELLQACATLKEKGYIPLQGNPGMFGQLMLYPYICNMIVHAEDAEAVYESVNTCAPGVSEFFRDPLQFLYDLTAEGYYDYKTVENELGLYKSAGDDAVVSDFLAIKGGEKQNDVGPTAFTASTQSLLALMDTYKSDYHSEIEYAFILAPVGEEGGYAYMSPAHGIAVNNASANLDWSLKFLNFLFTESVMTEFATAFGIIPNISAAMDYIHKTFDIPANRVCDLGQATFSYGFYNLINESLVEIAKANNPKYMEDDGAGGLKMTDFETFMSRLEERFAKQREASMT